MTNQNILTEEAQVSIAMVVEKLKDLPDDVVVDAVKLLDEANAHIGAARKSLKAAYLLAMYGGKVGDKDSS